MAGPGVLDIGAAELEDLLRGEHRLVLVDFWTPGCEPCRELRPQLERLAAARPDVCVVAAVDADREPAAVTRHGVGEFPTLVFFNRNPPGPLCRRPFQTGFGGFRFKQGRELHRFRGGALPASTLRLLGPGT